MSKRVGLCLSLVLAVQADAAPIAVPRFIDLSDEKSLYDRLDRNRKISLSMLGVTAVGIAGVTYGYLGAFDARTRLLRQVSPVDLLARQSLINSGQLDNTIGIIGLVVAIAAAALSITFLALSFE